MTRLVKVEVVTGSLVLEWPIDIQPVQEIREFKKGEVLELPITRVRKLGHDVKIIDEKKFDYTLLLQQKAEMSKAEKDVVKPFEPDTIIEPVKFSIILLTYNKKDRVLPNLSLLKTQMREGDELIVIDDGSTDGTKETLEEMSGLTYKWREHKGHRVASMRNIGLKTALNPFIISLDEDCIPSPSLLDTYRKEAKQGVLLQGIIHVEKDKTGETSYVMRGGSGNLCFSKKDAENVRGFTEAYDGAWGYADMDFTAKLKYNNVKIVDSNASVRHKWHPTPKGRDPIANIKLYEQNLLKYKKGIILKLEKTQIKVDVESKPVNALEPVKYKPEPFNLAELKLSTEVMQQSFLKHTKYYHPEIARLLPSTYNIYKLNIIIPVHNQKNQLHVCLTKMLPDLERFDELVVVDYGSTDGVQKVIQEFIDKYPQISFIKSGRSSLAEARNTGVLSIDYGSYRAGNVILWNVEIDPPPHIIKAYRTNFLFDPPIDELTKISVDKPILDLNHLSIGFYAETNHVTALNPVFNEMKKKKHPVFHIESVQSLNKRKRFFADKTHPFVIPPADIYVCCTSEHYPYRRFDIAKTIFCLHGLNPIELSCFPAHRVNMFLASFLPGSWWLEKVLNNPWNRQYGDKKFPPNFFHVVGWPKGDILFKPEIDTQLNYLISQYPLKLPYHKTVLYAPTGFYLHGYSSFNGTVLKLIEVTREMKVNLIIKSHPHLSRPESKDVIEQAQKECKRSKVNSHATWVKWEDLADLSPLYKIADVLVSDASSTLLEFLLTGKPSVEMMNRGYDSKGVFHKGWARWTQWLDAVKDYKGPADALPKNHALFDDWRGCFMPEGSTIRCWKTDDLREVLSEALENPKKGKGERAVWRNKLCGPNDGKSTERTIKAIIKVAGEMYD